MNIYTGIYLILRTVMLPGLFAINIMIANTRINKLKAAVNKNAVWMKNLSRAQHFFVRSIIGFFALLIGEAISIWLLYMGGAFKV